MDIENRDLSHAVWRKVYGWGFLFGFISFYPVDAVLYFLRGIGIDVPVGFIAAIFVTAVAISVPLLRRRGALLKKDFDYFVLCMFIVFSCVFPLTSKYFDSEVFFLVFWYLVSFVLGSWFPYIQYVNAKALFSYLLSTALLCSILLFNFFDWSLLILDFHGSNVNYIRIGAGMFYLYLALFFYARSEVLRLIVYVVGIGILFFIQSRLWFFLWLSVPAFYWAGRSRSNTKVLAVIGISFIGANFAISLLQRAEEIFSLRLFRFIKDVDLDTSLERRIYYFEMGIKQLIENPFFGYYKGYLSYAIEGAYIHNVISFWHAFGVIAFVLLLTLIASSSRLIFLNTKGNGHVLFAKALYIYILISYVFSRAYVTPDLFMALGLATAVIKNKHSMLTNKSNITNPPKEKLTASYANKLASMEAMR